MAKADFLPDGESDFLAWHDQFKTAAAAVIGQFQGMNITDLDPTQADNTDIHEAKNGADAALAQAKQKTALKNAAFKAAEKNIRQLAKRLKAHPAYTPALGERMGIEGPEDALDMDAQKPVLKTTAQGNGVVEIAFNKLKAEGVRLYTRREGEAAWTLLARENYSPYVDNRPLAQPGKPEQRFYKARFVKGHDEVGLESDVAEAVARP